MNIRISSIPHQRRSLLAVALTATLLTACASAPVVPVGASDVRAKLSALEMDSARSARIPVAMREAETAVALAERPVGSDAGLGDHRVLMADRSVEIAMARASTREAEAQRERLAQQGADARLAARTREADRARSDAQSARLASDQARLAAAAQAEEEASRLRGQIEALKARDTDRGLVLTLGDVLFETNQSELRPGATGNLTRLVAFLEEYPERTVLIEGHTDNVGADDYNQSLSQRRADAVGAWLRQSGVDGQRVSASGKGESLPVADNDSSTGRQMNRRVEVIIQND